MDITEAERADAEAARANSDEERIGQLEQQPADQVAKYEKHHQATNEAFESERADAREARETLAEARGRLAVLEEQAERYWGNKNSQPGKKAGK